MGRPKSPERKQRIGIELFAVDADGLDALVTEGPFASKSAAIISSVRLTRRLISKVREGYKIVARRGTDVIEMDIG